MIKNEASFVLEEDDRHLNIQRETVEQYILQHIRSCADIIIVTSVDRQSRFRSVEDILKRYNKEIRTFSLTGDFFLKDDNHDGASISDLADMADLILGSTHSEKYFIVILDNADDLKASDIEELCDVVSSLNKENNHISILLVCDPIFVITVKEAKGINDLTISECSLDKISQEDIQSYIDAQQQDITPNKKLQFDTSALKFIATHATGSLYEASIILEWCRLYANHKTALKIDSTLVNQMFGELLSAGPETGKNLLADYPPDNYNFDENVEISSVKKQKPLIKPSNNFGDESSTTNSPEYTENTLKKFVRTNEKSQEKKIPTLHSQENKGILGEEKKQFTSTTKSEDIIDSRPTVDIPVTANENKKPVLAWILVICLIAFVLYYFSPELMKLEQDNKNDIQQVIANQPQEDSLDETFEEITLPEEEIIAPAYPQEITVDNETQAQSIITEQPPADEPVEISNIETSNEEIIDDESLEPVNPEDYSNAKADENIEKAPINNEVLNQVKPKDATTNNINEQTVDVLLEIAAEQFSKKELTTPDISNAFSTYQLILQIDPENQQASDGLARIVERYKDWINTDINNNNFRRARVFLNRAFRVAPDDQDLKRLSNELEQ